MFKRTKYLKKIAPFINKPVIKVIVGMRRTGKSYFIRQVIEELKEQNILPNNIVYINKESIEFDFIRNYKDLYEYIQKSFKNSKGQKYIFIDEIQEIKEWEKTVSSFSNENGYDIYLTGSNAHLLSSEIATLLSGRYVEFPIYSLSFEEFLVFRGPNKKDIQTEFLHYLRYGGFPIIHHLEFEEETIYQCVQTIYNTILLRDIVARNKIRNITLLENLSGYLIDNIGNVFSARRIADYLKSQRLSVGIETIQNYISYIASTFVVHKVPRYDIRGKRLLEIYEKYYLGDIGIRNAMFGYKESDVSGVLENIVFHKLKQSGYQVYIGKWDDYEVDFVAQKAHERVYVQVAYLLSSPETIQREFSVLQKIKDNYPKYVVSMDNVFEKDYKGIKRINLIDFLLMTQP